MNNLHISILIGLLIIVILCLFILVKVDNRKCGEKYCCGKDCLSSDDITLELKPVAGGQWEVQCIDSDNNMYMFASFENQFPDWWNNPKNSLGIPEKITITNYWKQDQNYLIGNLSLPTQPFPGPVIRFTLPYSDKNTDQGYILFGFSTDPTSVLGQLYTIVQNGGNVYLYSF